MQMNCLKMTLLCTLRVKVYIDKALRLSQEGDNNHVPLLGMTFESENEAHRFYNAFACITGFSIISKQITDRGPLVVTTQSQG